MSEDFSKIDGLTNDELAERFEWSQRLMNRCLDEQRRRHGEEVNKLRKALDRIGAISTKETSRSIKSVEDRTIDCTKTTAVVSAMSESDKTPKNPPNGSNQFCAVVHNVVGDGEDISLPSNASGASVRDSDDCVGRDRNGDLLHIGDTVEVLSSSRNGFPFKYKDEAFVLHSPGLRIRISRTDDIAATSLRDSNNLLLKPACLFDSVDLRLKRTKD